MLCPWCHTENREGRRFCSKCAAPLAIVCASCGFPREGPGKLVTLDEALKPALLALLDVPVDDAAWRPPDPGPAALPHPRRREALADAGSA